MSTAPRQGDLIVTEDPTSETGELRFPVLENEDGELLLAPPLYEFDSAFAPLPGPFAIKDGILVGGAEGFAVRAIIEGGCPSVIIENYKAYTDLVHKALQYEPTTEVYQAVFDRSEEELDSVVALTCYGGAFMDSTVLAAALLLAIGIPLPSHDKIILLGASIDNILDAYLGEDDDDISELIAGLEEDAAQDAADDEEDETCA